MLVRSEHYGARILAWTLPDIDLAIQDPPTFLATTTHPPRVALFFKSINFGARREILGAALPVLPLSGLVTLIAQDVEITFDMPFWIRQAPKWPLLRRAQLIYRAHEGFGNMLLDRNNGGPPLLPLLTELVLVGCLKYDWPSALKKRAEQGVPLERLDLRMSYSYSYDGTLVPLLSKIVADTLGPQKTPEILEERAAGRWKTVVCAPFSEELIFPAEFESYTDDGEDEHHDE